MATNIEIVYAPGLCNCCSKGGDVVLIDIARFTTTLVTALANGALQAEAYSGQEIPLSLKPQGYLLCGECQGNGIPGFDFNNSPLSMTRANVEGRKLAFSTTNGTYTRSLIQDYDAILAGSFLNVSALVRRLISDGRNARLVCSGRGRNVSTEDLIFAGLVATRLVQEGGYSFRDDTVPIAMALWQLAKHNPKEFALKNSPQLSYLYKTRPRYRADLDTLFDIDKFDIVPEEISPLKFVAKQ